jgi:ATP-dependent RNA helicase DeaD
MVSAFEELGLLPQFMQAVEQLGFEQPTPIQQAAIPALIAGRDVMGQAQTGTGKTAAFALPMLQKIQPGQQQVQALILTPTRELAVQVAEATSRLAQNTPLRTLAVYGGQAYHIQTRQLSRGVDVVVGTPGRLIDLIKQDILDLSEVRYLVLDEADEMLEMGFIDDVQAILAYIPYNRQMALFSATMPDAVRKLAGDYLNNPEVISVNPLQRTVAETEQRFCRMREEHKLEALSRMLEAEDVKSALIFARTKARAQELEDALVQRGFPAESLHGDLNQSRREAVLGHFRQHTISLLVATDVAARGLDIEDVSHVFNYDFPQDSEDYVHRIGRTGRAGKKGIAVTFMTPRERRYLSILEAYTRQRITECFIPTESQILALRDERFKTSLTERLAQVKASREHSLVDQLVEAGFDPADIAAAAMQLARADGYQPFEKIIEVEREPRFGRTTRPTYEDTPRPERSERSGRDNRKPAAPKGDWKHSEIPQRAARGKSRSFSAGMVTLKMNLGDAHGLRPSDVVGAIASEVGIPGRAIGAIDIHREHTFVDVAEMHVGQVLQQSTGQYLVRGKPVMLTLAN